MWRPAAVRSDPADSQPIALNHNIQAVALHAGQLNLDHQTRVGGINIRVGRPPARRWLARPPERWDMCAKMGGTYFGNCHDFDNSIPFFANRQACRPPFVHVRNITRISVRANGILRASTEKMERWAARILGLCRAVTRIRIRRRRKAEGERASRVPFLPTCRDRNLGKRTADSGWAAAPKAFGVWQDLLDKPQIGGHHRWGRREATWTGFTGFTGLTTDDTD